MEKKEQLYEGKAKKVYATEDPNLVIVSYKDDATAFDGAKKGTIVGKGVINNQMTNRLMAKMEKAGIPTHFVEELSERDTLVKKVSIVPLEVIIRNISAGHFASRYGVEEGIVFSEPTIEFSYKNDDLHDPLMNAYHAVALKLATWEEIELIKKYAFAVNDTLKAFWSECGVTLVDFKLEFGRLPDGTIDRRRLGALVFARPEQLQRLVGITFPLILAECKARMDAAERAGCRACILDAPTLFEAGGDRLCDVIVSVVTPKEERLRRILQRDGITPQAAADRMKNQHEDGFYTARSHFVITNSSDLAHLQNEVERCRRFLVL